MKTLAVLLVLFCGNSYAKDSSIEKAVSMYKENRDAFVKEKKGNRMWGQAEVTGKTKDKFGNGYVLDLNINGSKAKCQTTDAQSRPLEAGYWVQYKGVIDDVSGEVLLLRDCELKVYE